MAKIIWLKDAADDLAALKNTLANENKITIKNVAEAFKMSLEVLNHNYHLGKPVEYLSDYRDWVIPFGNKDYALRYRIYNDVVYIVQVLYKS